MKNLLPVSVVSIVLFAWTICGCSQKKSPEPLVIDVLKPRIKSISFKGIPDSNIEIDQKNLLIKVKVPTLLQEDLDPVIELSDNARIRGGYTELINEAYGGVGLFMEDSVPISLVYKDDPLEYPQPVVMYHFKLLASGSLNLKPLDNVLTHELFNPNLKSIFIPFENLYGNSLPSSVTLTDKISGKVYNTDQNLFKGFGPYVNYLGVRIDRYDNLVPGNYVVKILSANGAWFQVNQTLIIKKGPVAIYYPRIYFGYDVVPGKELSLEGNNLFKGYFSISLTDKNEKVLQLTNLEFNDTGTLVSARIPNDLAIGQYVLRCYQEGAQTNLCYRVNVIEPSVKRTFIGTIGDDYAPCSLKDAAVVKREEQTFFTYFSDFPGTPRLRIVAQDIDVTGYALVASYENPTSPFPPNVTFSKQTKSGYYQAILEIVNQEGIVISESLPYTRLIKIE